MRQLNFEFKEILRRHPAPSFVTRDGHLRRGKLAADAFFKVNNGKITIAGIKPRHLPAIVSYFMNRGYKAGAMKNMMWTIRKILNYGGKPGMVAPSNRAYGIPNRDYIPKRNRAHTLVAAQLDRITDFRTLASLLLQELFGMRVEESIKANLFEADQGYRLRLKSSWCKGGRVRYIVIRDPVQRHIVDWIKSIVGPFSLIPSNKSYIQQRNRFYYQCARAGIRNPHGLRHGFAQRLYFALTGLNCPLCGGRNARQLSVEERAADRFARLTISAELGHGRPQITVAYLGR